MINHNLMSNDLLIININFLMLLLIIVIVFGNPGNLSGMFLGNPTGTLSGTLPGTSLAQDVSTRVPVVFRLASKWAPMGSNGEKWET